MWKIHICLIIRPVKKWTPHILKKPQNTNTLRLHLWLPAFPLRTFIWEISRLEEFWRERAVRIFMGFFVSRLSVISVSSSQYVVVGRASRDGQPQCRIQQHRYLQKRVQKKHDWTWGTRWCDDGYCTRFRFTSRIPILMLRLILNIIKLIKSRPW